MLACERNIEQEREEGRGEWKERHTISSLLKLVNLRFQNGGKLLLGLSLNVNIYVMRD